MVQGLSAKKVFVVVCNLPSGEPYANHQGFYMNLKHQFTYASLHLLLLLPDLWLLDVDLDIGFQGIAALAI